MDFMDNTARRSLRILVQQQLTPGLTLSVGVFKWVKNCSVCQVVSPATAHTTDIQTIIVDGSHSWRRTISNISFGS